MINKYNSEESTIGQPIGDRKMVCLSLVYTKCSGIVLEDVWQSLNYLSIKDTRSVTNKDTYDKQI